MHPRFSTFRLVQIGAILLGLALIVPQARADEPDEPTNAILVDAFTGNVLYAKAPDARFSPGNAAKLMTMAVMFDAIERNLVSPQTPYTGSEYAWRTGGAPSRNTTLFVKIRDQVPIIELLRGIGAVQANDASIILAEGFSGDELSFVAVMNKMADDIGLQDTRFSNSTGLPAPGQMTTARDIAKLARHIVENNAGLYEVFKHESVNWSGIFQRNKLPYLGELNGVDGMTIDFLPNEVAHMAVVTAKREERRFIAVVAGAKTVAARDKAVKELIELGFTGFIERELFAAGGVVTRIRVHGGAETHVPLTSEEAIRIALPRQGPGAVSARVIYDGPLMAPLRKGERVAILRLSRDGQVQREIPLVTAADVPTGGLWRRAGDGVRELGRGLIVNGARALFSPGS